MKILLISPVPLISENTCGISKILFNYLSSESGNHFDIYMPEGESRPREDNFPKSSKFYYRLRVNQIRNMLTGKIRASFNMETISQIVTFIKDHEADYDVIHLFGYAFIPITKRLGQGVKNKVTLSLIDSHPLFFIRRAREEQNFFKKALYKREARKYYKLECNISTELRVHFVSRIDKHYFEKSHDFKFKKVASIENGVSAECFHPLTRKVDDRKKNRILFFGNLEYSPNKDALNFICNELAPYLEAKAEKVSIVIAGNSKKNLVPPANVSFCGYVEDLNLLLNEVDITIFPLFFGTGIKNKVLEAFSAGSPLISTQVGLEGIPHEKLPKDYPLRIIDERDPAAWVNSIKELLHFKDNQRQGFKPFTWSLFKDRMLQFYFS